MSSLEIPGPMPPESVVLLMRSDSTPHERGRFLDSLHTLFSHMNWRSHVFVVSETREGQTENAAAIIRLVGRFLDQQKLSTFLVHPCLTMRPAGSGDEKIWQHLTDFTTRFQREAYDQQGEARLLLLPIFEPAEPISPGAILSAAEFLRARLAKSSFYFRGYSPLDPRLCSAKEIRIYVDPDESSGSSGLMRQLWANHVFEGILERVAAGGPGMFDPCRSQLVVDEEGGLIHACFARWEEGEPLGRIDGIAEILAEGEHPRDRAQCRACIHRCCAAMERNIAANGRIDEGRQAYLQVGIALSRLGDHERAEENACRAYVFSNTDDERAAALLHQGLCNLSMSRFERADELLERGQRLSSDPGLFAYHRGRVQFAWRDYIEAIDRFSEALASPSAEVREEDVLFDIAVSHINIEEFDDAERYLDQMIDSGVRTAPVLMYLGICDLGRGLAEPALERFRAALAEKPADEDLSRILFFVGASLKELGRFDEAIPELQKAVAADADDIANHNLLGFCLYKEKRHAEAVECFRKAIEIDPESAIDHANLGSNLRDLGRTEEAIEAYETALALDPTIEFARDSLSKLRGEQED